jgi:hypothetical protein
MFSFANILKKSKMQELDKPQEGQEQVVVPDEKSIRSALAGDDYFSLEEGQIPERQEEVKPVDAAQEKPVQEPGKNTPPANDQVLEFKYEPVWDQIKLEFEEQHGVGTFKKPEGITPETEKKVLLDFLSQAIEPSYDDFPPELKEQIELHKKGVYNPDEYFKQRSPENDFTKLSDDDFLFALFKQEEGKSENNPDGLSDEEIKDDLSRMSRIEKKQLARARRNEILEKREQYRNAEAERIKQVREKSYEEINAKKIEMAQKVVNQHKEVTDYYGIEATPEEKAKFDKDFLEMIKINKETGTHKIAEMLNDDAVFYKTAFFLWKGEKGLKGYISDLKESVKKNIEEKIDPVLEPGRGSTKLASAVDREKLV